jgi:hypothetical protein
MDSMTARQVLRRLTRRKHIFSTDRAIVFVLVLETLVGVKDGDRDTHATLTTVSKGISTADTAKSTFSAMKWLFRLKNTKQNVRKTRT